MSAAISAVTVYLYNEQGADRSYLSRKKTNKRYNLNNGFEGFVDEYPYGGEARHEIHVYKDGKEVGMFQNGEWRNKHGFSGMPSGFNRRNSEILKGLDVHMMHRQGRIPRGSKLGKGLLTGYAKALPVFGVVFTAAEMYGSSSPWDSLVSGFGINQAGAGSTLEPEGIRVTYP